MQGSDVTPKNLGNIDIYDLDDFDTFPTEGLSLWGGSAERNKRTYPQVQTERHSVISGLSSEANAYSIDMDSITNQVICYTHTFGLQPHFN